MEPQRPTEADEAAADRSADGKQATDDDRPAADQQPGRGGPRDARAAAESDPFAEPRRLMLDRQLRGRGIRSAITLDAMARVPREQFVPANLRHLAYSDDALSIGRDQTISQPYMVARMTELLDPQPSMRVLEVGTGSGYQAALLATIGCRVLSVERHEQLAVEAKARMEALGLSDRVTIVVGDGSVGRSSDAPFDGIVVTAAAPRIPPELPDQLAIGGRLVVPVGRRDRQELMLVERVPEGFRTYDCGPCVFVPLVGVGGFGEAAPGRWFDRIL